MKSLLMVLMLAAGLALMGCEKQAEDPEPKVPESKTSVVTDAATLAAERVPQTVCPVMGGKINKDIFVDHEGQRVYFCCAGCEGTFKKNADEYLKKMADAGVKLDPTP